MGLKHRLFADRKHYWHLSRKKLARMEVLYDIIDSQRGVPKSSGRYADFENLEEGGSIHASVESMGR